MSAAPGGRPPDGTRSVEQVFIVGLPRTGSTLTRAILNRSPLVRISGETHFLAPRSRFGRRRRYGYGERLISQADLTTDDGLQCVVDAIYRERGKSFWSRLAACVERPTLEALVRSAERTPRGLFDAAMRAFAGDRPVRGDKTPEHVFSVPTLMEWFPRARVIHTFRDPRAIHVSLRRKEQIDRLGPVARLIRRTGPLAELYVASTVAVDWRRMAKLHRRYAATYPGRYRLVRFEDLLADPERVTRELCEFVNVPFQAEMLEQEVLNSSFRPQRGQAGIDAGAAERWRHHLSPIARWWIELWCRRELAAFGYGQ
ncbi:MAG TPA: sulfotransferase [candidate division Zixibacteria bacterium]|nr:sulfotransferase [candidate division Zixibacteria bacterium]